MPAPCPNCMVVTKAGQPITTCDGCRAEVHLACVGLSNDDIRITRNKSRSIKIICNSCNHFMGELGDIKSFMRTMQEEFKERINKLEEKISHNSAAEMNALQGSIKQLQTDFSNFKNLISADAPRSSQDSLFEEVFHEFNERQTRKCNLIIFGLAESRDVNAVVRIDEEKSFISNLAESAGVALQDLQNLKPFRLGRHLPGKVRPLKVTLEGEDQVKQIISKAKDLKSLERFKDISISYDRTRRQLDLYRKVRMELEERKRNGETGIKIVYTNGVPAIKSLN